MVLVGARGLGGTFGRGTASFRSQMVKLERVALGFFGMSGWRLVWTEAKRKQENLVIGRSRVETLGVRGGC